MACPAVGLSRSRMTHSGSMPPSNRFAKRATQQACTNQRDRAKVARWIRQRGRLCRLVLAGEGAAINTTTTNGRLVFAIFAGLAEFERELIVERVKAGLAAARTLGHYGGRPFKITLAKLRLARAAMGQPETKVADLCAEAGVTRQTLYRFVGPKGEPRGDVKQAHGKGLPE